MPDDNNDMVKIIENEGPYKGHKTPFHKIFWEQHAEAARKNKTQGMRWAGGIH